VLYAKERMKRARSIRAVRNEARSTWVCFPIIDGKRTTRKLGNLNQLTREQANAKAAQVMTSLKLKQERSIPTVSELVAQYRAERMPQRYSTRRSYECWFRKHIIPCWGDQAITDVQARSVELWLQSLALTPKSKAHIRGLLHILLDYAMWRGDMPVQRNPMELVTVRGSSKRTRIPRSLTVEEFQEFMLQLSEPFYTIALVCVCFGLRISECLALKWGDVDWIHGKLTVQRGIVRQRVGEVKTVYSGRKMSIDAAMLELLKHWKQTTQFPADDDWMFGSPVKLGRQPWSYDQIWRSFRKAASDAGIDKIGTHSMRHTYRSWLDAAGTPIAVQQKLMRHGDIRTTMNVYGDVITNEMAEAHSKVVRMALPPVN